MFLFYLQWWAKGDEVEGSEADEEDCAGVCGRERWRDGGVFSFFTHFSLTSLLGFFPYL